MAGRTFTLFSSLIQREAGIYLPESKKALVMGRLARRLRDLGLESFEAYYERVELDQAERIRMLDRICTNETHFFREPRQFEFLEENVFPEWTGRAAALGMPRRISAWCAACSVGEEPYSLAMILLDRFPPSSGWQVEILATDLSTHALDRAREATWPLEKAKEIPQRYLKSFMLKGTGAQEGRMKAGPEIRSCVRFQRLNLNDDRYPVAAPFDLIFCRNVLIYFNADLKARVIQRLLDAMAPTGFLFLGHAESLNGFTDRARSVGPTVYRHASAQPGGTHGSVRAACGPAGSSRQSVLPSKDGWKGPPGNEREGRNVT